MQRPPGIPSSVDVSGDLSRQQPSRHMYNVSHKGNVGPAIEGKNYHPAMHTYDNAQEGIRNDALECALVLATPSENGDQVEYRVGKFKSATELLTGLSDTMVRRTCFGRSDVYANRSDAIAAADAHYPRHQGIKVIHKPEPYN